MATSDPLTGATIYSQTDAALGGQQLGDIVTDLRSYVLPRFSTTAARDAAYTAWTSAGNTLATGMTCMVGTRMYYYSGGWQARPGFLGSASAYPSDAVAGDTFRHSTYGCGFVLSGAGSWKQTDVATVANSTERASYIAALVSAGLGMHNGFLLFETSTNRMYVSIGGTTLLYQGGGAPPVTTLTLLGGSGWQAGASNVNTLGYSIDGSGYVHLQGCILNTNQYGPGYSNSIATLPAEARPANINSFPIDSSSGGAARLQITSSGDFKIAPNALVPALTSFYLDGVVYRPG